MKSRPLLITLSVVLLLGLACWPAFSSRAAAGHTGAGQQVGEPFRVPAIAAGDFHSLALKSDGTVVAWGNNVSGQTTIPGGLSNVTAIAAGDFHSLALKSDGTVVAWGNDVSGQTAIPSGLSNVTAIAAGGAHSLALKSDGTVVAWGNNFSGQTTIPSGLSNVTAIAASGAHNLALKSDGTVIAWGRNNAGQTTIPSGLSNVTAIAAGGTHGLALKSDGTVVAWGDNFYGQTTIPSGLSNVMAIAAGDGHSLALKSDGSVVAWGRNREEQTTIPGGLSDVTAIAAGFGHSLALKSDGSVVGWGDNSDGQTTIPGGLTVGSKRVLGWGDNGSGQTTIPSGLSNVTAIAAGRAHSLALNGNGTVVAWGNNSDGQTTIPGGLSNVTAIAAGDYHSLALKSDGTVVGWGYNFYGQTTIPGGLSSVTAIAAGHLHSLALKSDGTVIAWGINDSGQRTIPGGLSGVVAIAAGGTHNLALKSDGTVVAWGGNDSGQATVPGGLSGVVAIAAGAFHSMAIKSDGTIVAWGDNFYGETTIPGGLSNVTAIAAGRVHSLALKSNGTVVAWGDNFYGETTIPGGLSNVTAIAAGGAHSLTLSLDDTPPTITPQTVARTAGAGSSNSQIVTAGDNQDAANTLQIQISSDGMSFGNTATAGNVTVTLTDRNAGAAGINPDATGKVFADVVAACTATTADFTLRVTDSGNLATDAIFTVTVNPNPAPVLGYSSQNVVFGTTPTFSPSTPPSDNVSVAGIALQSINPPTGLTLNVNNSNGQVNIVSASIVGSYTVTIRVTDNCGAGTNAIFTVNVTCPTITLSSLPNGTGGSFYDQTVTVSPAGGNYSLLQTGTLPPGLSFNAATGRLSGTPTQNGTFNFSITATGFGSCMQSQSYAITIACPTITLSSLPNGTGGSFYDQTVTVSPAGGNYSLLQTGTLPPGLSFNAATGRLSGTPTQNGTFNFSITATGFGSCMQSQSYAITIACPTITLSSLPNGTGGSFYDQTVTVSPAGGNYLLLQTGTLPPGLSFNAATGRLSGTPTQNGTFNFSITATGFGSCMQSQSYAITIGCPTIALAPLPPATAGVAYNQTLTAWPAGAYSFAQNGGTLPPGLTPASSGTITGTPTQAGTFNFTVTATGFGGCVQTLPVTLVVNCPTITLAPTSLPNATINAAYPTTLTATPSGAYSFAVTSGLLPPGLTLNSNGSFGGAPTQSGVFNFRVTATGFGSCSGFRDYTLVVTCPTITLDATPLPNGTIGATYNQTRTASPAGSYSYAVSSGALPVGLTLNASTGALTGTPTTAGTFNFTITATAGACSGQQSYSLTIGCATITLASPANGEAGVNYAGSVAASPSGSYTYSVTAGGLPSGLALNSTTGAVTGWPSITGTYTFTIKAQTTNGCSGQQSYTLVIACPTITLSALAMPTLNSPYNQVVTASPSGGNYSFAVTTGALPTGLSLNAATGAITGTPTAGGAYNFTITATGFGSCTGTRAYSGTIEGSACPTITPADLPSGQPGQLYSNSVAASPAGSYSYAVTTGSLPPGLTLYGSFGLLYGYPTTAGTFNFTVTATDSNNCTGAKSYSVVIGGTSVRSLVFGDFDGDGKADLSVWRGASGEWLTVNSGDGKAQSTVWGSSAAPYFDVMTPGDYDGDGKMDLAVFRRSTGEWFIKGSKDGAVTTKLWGLGTDVPVPGDYDGDGKTDIAVWRGTDTNWYIIRSSDGQVQTTSWGTSKAPYNDVPVAADFDGDGKTDIAVFRRANGHWYIKLSSDGSVIDKAWGIGTDVPVVADYDGDGKADIAVWRGADTNWYVVQSSDGAVKAISLGNAALNDVPVPGDYDGDGKADVAVWRASSGTWLIKAGPDGSVVTKNHGHPGDAPVTNRP